MKLEVGNNYFLIILTGKLFLKKKINGQDQKNKSYGVVQPESFCFKNQQCKNCKYQQRDHFLYHFELYQAKKSAIFSEANLIGWHLKKYSKGAMIQLIKTIDIRPIWLNYFHSENLRWPYQAVTINRLLEMRSMMV